MKRMFFLVLTLMVLSAASVNAQVQIGGTKGPDKSAVLDLNGDGGTATGGLALPRVELTSTTQQLNGVTAQPGTVVYNTSAALGGEGTYVWTKVDGGGTISSSKIVTEKADSGKVLVSDGTTVSWGYANLVDGGVHDISATFYSTHGEVKWLEAFRANVTDIVPAHGFINLAVPGYGIDWSSFCTSGPALVTYKTYKDHIVAINHENTDRVLGNVYCFSLAYQ